MFAQPRFKNPLALMPIGMMFLVIAILFPMLTHPSSKLSQDWFDGIRGLLYGLSIGFNLMAVRMKARAQRCVGN
jgi:hypothetical protein